MPVYILKNMEIWSDVTTAGRQTKKERKGYSANWPWNAEMSNNLRHQTSSWNEFRVEKKTVLLSSLQFDVWSGLWLSISGTPPSIIATTPTVSDCIRSTTPPRVICTLCKCSISMLELLNISWINAFIWGGLLHSLIWRQEQAVLTIDKSDRREIRKFIHDW